jgi:sigma-B regulation protein RsbU (phosphoserine phosphatase)
VDGKDYFIAFAPIESSGWSFAAAFAADDVVAPAAQNKADISKITEEKTSYLQGQMLSTMLLMAVSIVVLLAAVVYSGRRLSRRFVAPISELADGVREIASGNLDKKLDITTGDEIEHLAICFNSMTDELKAYIDNLSKATAEREKAAAELSVARNIQLGALPQDFLTAYQEFQINAAMDAAKGVGGDFYDFYMTDENHLVITIADVSGKGIPAALYMMRAKTTLKNMVLRAKNAADFADCMKMANRELCRENEEMMFVTAFMARLDLTTGELVYVNGGHNPPLVQADGKFCYLQQARKHMMLGINEDEMYEAHSLAMQPGDIIFLYTDGVTEAMNEAEELYSEERLQATLNRQTSKDVKEILAAVRQDVNTYAGDAEQSDDITMLGLKFCGSLDDV